MTVADAERSVGRTLTINKDEASDMLAISKSLVHPFVGIGFKISFVRFPPCR